MYSIFQKIPYAIFFAKSICWGGCQVIVQKYKLTLPPRTLFLFFMKTVIPMDEQLSIGPPDEYG